MSFQHQLQEDTHQKFDELPLDNRLLATIETEVCGYFTLDQVSVPSETIGELLRYFEDTYYVHAIFLQPIHSLTLLASGSQLLFWTII
ncbi:hypothetical protein GQ53DRAFT_824444 [Thozetella sp. PMI_491]|nr:hypothetical protein GQ53DRAFT_824444 [Thozetella sp. PMI_491]